MLLENPFNPAFGKVPEIFIDRDEAAARIVTGLKKLNGPYQTTLISGIRGVGKTALFNDICRQISADSKWITAKIPSDGDILETLIQAIHYHSDSDFKKIIESVDGISFNIMGSGMNITRRNEKMDPQFVLEEILKKMKDKGRALLIAIDEVQSSSCMRRFASVYQILIGEEYPLACLMTGLPNKISELQNDPVLTFLLRSMRIDLPMLNPVSVQYTYKEEFQKGNRACTPGALREMVRLTQGYSYAFQLLGYLLWEAGDAAITAESISAVMDDYEKMLYKNAYHKIYEELSGMDRSFVQSIALSDKQPVPMKFIGMKTGKSSGYLSTYRARLLDAGVITSPVYGHVDFALPLFDQYIRQFHLEEEYF